MTEFPVEVSEWCRGRMGAEDIALLGAFEAAMRREGIYADLPSTLAQAFTAFGASTGTEASAQTIHTAVNTAFAANHAAPASIELE